MFVIPFWDRDEKNMFTISVAQYPAYEAVLLCCSNDTSSGTIQLRLLFVLDFRGPLSSTITARFYKGWVGELNGQNYEDTLPVFLRSLGIVLTSVTHLKMWYVLHFLSYPRGQFERLLCNLPALTPP